MVETWEWKVRELTGALFVAITGKNVAPPLYNSMELLGKDLSRVRIVAAIQKLGGISKDAIEELERDWKERQAKRGVAPDASSEEEKLV